MGNYLIMDNVNSNTITGLLIQNLPPISKPRQRVDIEEIDGRDGDIITPLGYGAYDKEFQIGLTYNYDINEIIKFFNSEGTVIFSNEPTKYYNYKIIEQIDFERLIRFKTATVKMHVQPFKYSTTEQPIGHTYTSQTTEGKSITLNDTVPNIFNEFSIRGNTEQDGTQTPDNPVELKNAGDSGTITEKICNKNLFDKNNPTIINAFVDGTTGLLKAPTNNQKSIVVRLMPDTIFTISGVERPSSNYGLYNDNTLEIGTSIATQKGNITNGKITITTGANTKWLVFLLGGGAETYGYNNIQVEVGSIETEYTTYDGQSFTIPCQQPMRSIGDVKDEFVKVDGVWYERHHIKSIIIDGYHTGWSRQSNFNCFSCASSILQGIKLPANGDALPEIKCSHFVPESYNKVYTNINPTDNSIGLEKNGTNNPRIHMSSITSAQDFITWLQNNDVEIAYVLNNPVDLACTQAQIDALENNKYSYDGQTNIGSDDETPASVRVTFNDNSVVNVTNNGNIYSKPTFTIEGSGDIGVYLNNSQVFEINLGDEGLITIDIERMEAYKGTVLKNRLVKGNYENFLLQVGTNAISFTGAIETFEISKYSRWI